MSWWKQKYIKNIVTKSSSKCQYMHALLYFRTLLLLPLYTAIFTLPLFLFLLQFHSLCFLIFWFLPILPIFILILLLLPILLFFISFLLSPSASRPLPIRRLLHSLATVIKTISSHWNVISCNIMLVEHSFPFYQPRECPNRYRVFCGYTARKEDYLT